MKRRGLGSILLAAVVVLASLSLGCASKRQPKPASEEVPVHAAPPPPADTSAAPDKSPGPAPMMRATPVSQVGFERGAPGHAGMSVTGLRSKDSPGNILVEQHHALPENAAIAARGLALVKDIEWWPAGDEPRATLALACTDCADIDQGNDRFLPNVTFVSSSYDPVARKTIITLADKLDPARTLVLRFSDTDEAGRWASAARASAGVAEATTTVPQGSSSATLRFQLGEACSTAWTWIEASAG